MSASSINNQEKIFIRRRLEAVTGLIAVGFLLLTIRAVDLHWLQADELQAMADRQHFRQFETTAPRGPILDRHGRTLSESIEVPSIAAIGREVSESDIPRLAAALGISEKKLSRKLKQSQGFIWLARQVNPAMADKVMALNIEGVRQETEWRRYHPLGPEIGHLLGFVGIDGSGLEGVERNFNDTLAGTPGIRLVQRDARGRSLPGGIWLKDPKRGKTIQLSLDSTIQSIAYAALADGIRQQNAKGGSVVVMRPEDGAIVAMANWPGFNPNSFGRHKPGEWRNRVITDVFEPGSTLKPFTIAAALDSGKWKPESRVFCEEGKYQVADHTIHDDHREGWLDLTGLISRSSNIGVAKVALDIGPERLYNTLTEVGFERRSGIGLSGESPGIIPPIGRWGPVETANIAFGQGIAVTPLQLATAFCVLANDGNYVAPKLLAGEKADKMRRVMPEKTARTIVSMLEVATGPDGTGSQAVPAGYRVAGKTGTAQKASADGSYADDRFTAVFAGIAPADNPELVVVVVIDEPQKSIYGGQVAAPVFRNIVATALPYLGISPSRSGTPEWQLLNTSLSGSSEADSHHSLVRLSLREARRVASARGFQLRTHGTGWVSRQEPHSLDSVAAGEMVEVWLNE
ncbi:MAG: penicillin-binding transpeptidase domain-containing protein [Mariprofundaceae bacterium]|nr:penicillin-binding transpeptidase domain-containing protein [Mariprofundaceae bacterium]